MATSTTYDKLTCQTCGETFDTALDKNVHATIGHSRDEKPRKIIACSCTASVFAGERCDSCGRLVDVPDWWHDDQADVTLEALRSARR